VCACDPQRNVRAAGACECVCVTQAGTCERRVTHAGVSCERVSVCVGRLAREVQRVTHAGVSCERVSVCVGRLVRAVCVCVLMLRGA
jgi:hypothetical protein